MTNLVYEMLCTTCGYHRIYSKRWEAEQSAKMHNQDNFCGSADAKVSEHLAQEYSKQTFDDSY